MTPHIKVLVTLSVFFSVALSTDVREPIDLTWPVEEKSLFWPGERSFVYTRKTAAYNENGEWYAANEFCMGEHVGTHLDAPYHFYRYGWKVSDIPLENLLTNGVVVDMSEIVNRLGPTIQLQETDLLDWERINGPLPNHCVVLVRFGWSQYYQSKDLYFGLNDTKMIFPGIAADAARWLVNSGKVLGVGVDTPSVDSGSDSTFPTHKIFAKNNVYNLESVNIPNKLPSRDFNLLILPLKLKEGTGSSVRIVAVPKVPLTPEIIEADSCYFTYNGVPWYGHTSVVLSSLLLLAIYTINCFTL